MKGVTMAKMVGFEYLGDDGDSLFEVYLRYSNEKERSSAELAKILQPEVSRDSVRILDVGSGTGEYLRLTLDRLVVGKATHITLLEPSPRMLQLLLSNAERLSRIGSIEVVPVTLDDFVPSGQYDVVLASHLPFPMDKVGDAYRKLVNVLKPNGRLIIVLRDEDDVHEFRTRFKPVLLGREFKSFTAQDAETVLGNLKLDPPLHVTRRQARSTLRFPIGQSPRDVVLLIEFLLNERWNKFSPLLQDEVLNFIRRKSGVFHQIDTLLVCSVRSPFHS